MTRLTSLGSWPGPIKHTRVLVLLKIHMTGKATHAVRRISWISQRAVRSDTEQATYDARHETDAGAASFIPLSRPEMRQTIIDPPNLPYPTCHKAVRGARARSSQLHLHIARRRRECRPGRRRHQWHSAAPLSRRGGRRRCSASCSPAGRRPPALQRWLR